MLLAPPTEPKTTVKISKNGSTLQKMIFRVTGTSNIFTLRTPSSRICAKWQYDPLTKKNALLPYFKVFIASFWQCNLMRDLWGTSRVARSNEIVFTTLVAGHRTSPFMAADYGKILWLSGTVGPQRAAIHQIWQHDRVSYFLRVFPLEQFSKSAFTAVFVWNFHEFLHCSQEKYTI